MCKTVKGPDMTLHLRQNLGELKDIAEKVRQPRETSEGFARRVRRRLDKRNTNPMKIGAIAVSGPLEKVEVEAFFRKGKRK